MQNISDEKVLENIETIREHVSTRVDGAGYMSQEELEVIYDKLDQEQERAEARIATRDNYWVEVDL